MSDWSTCFNSLPNGTEPDHLEALLEGLLSEDVCEERDFYCLPVCNDAPRLSEWKDEERPEVKLSFDKTDDMIWIIAKSEISTIRKNVRKELGCDTEIQPSLQQIASLFFGPDSKLSSLFQEKLDIDHETFMLFMSTYCLAKELSIPILHIYKGRIKTNDLMDYDSYLKIWKKLADQQNSRNRFAVPFWQEFEHEMNAIFQKLFVIGQTKMIISLDDDKRHYDNNSAQETDGLKQTVHAECRRKGFVAHSAVLPTCGIMVGVTWERVGDTNTSCYKRLVHDQFGGATGSNLPPPMGGFAFCSDRGYWCSQLLFQYLLLSGADIHGTVKRCPWYPFTYAQTLQSNDKRTPVQVNGMRTLLLKHYIGSNRKITAQAYRNGTGSVALTMSTLFREKQFDFITDKKQNKSVNQQTLPLSAFFRIVQAEALPNTPEIFSVDESIFNDLGIMIVTPRQGDPSWFIARMFSVTSTAAYLHIKFNLTERAAGNFGGLLPHWDMVRRYITSSFDESPGFDEEAEGHQSNEDVDTGGNIGEQPEQEVNVSNQARQIFTTLAEGVAATLPDTLKLISRAPQEVLADIYRLIRGNTEGQEFPTAKKLKDIKAWAQASPEHRPFVWFTVEELKQKIKEKGGQIKNNAKRDDLINTLRSLEGGNFSHRSTKALTPISIVIKTSFMQGLQGKAKKWASLGHHLEPILGNSLLHHSAEGKTMTAGLEVKQLYRVGLVQKKEQPCVKCSVAFFGIAEIDGVFCGFVVEVKGRVTGHTAQHAHELAWALGIDEDNPYIQVAYNSPDLKSYFEKVSESIQILHHAFTFGIKHVLLLVGDQTGIISGILVRFDDEILNDYGKCMKDIEESAMKWAYDESVPFPKNEIIEAVKQHPFAVDVGTVETSFQLWKALTADKNLPLPLCHRIVPLQAGFWNRVKGGSDVVTRLCNNVKSEPPIRSPQTSVVDRNLSLVLATIHRTNQVFTANIDLDRYSSLYNFRHAANSRSTFAETLHDLTDYFADQATTQQEDPTSQVRFTLPRRTDRGRVGEKIDWIAVAPKTGATPKKKAFESYKMDHQSLDIIVRDPHEKCTGCPIKRMKSNGSDRLQRKCVVCKKNTDWYCISCRHFACMSARPDELGDTVFRSVECTGDNQVEELVGRFTCSLHFHQQGLDNKCTDSP